MVKIRLRTIRRMHRTVPRICATIVVLLVPTACRTSVVALGAPPVGGAWVSIEDFAVIDGPVAKLRLNILAEGFALSGTWALGPLGGSLDGGSSDSSSGITIFLRPSSGADQIVFRGSIDSSVTLMQGTLDGSSTEDGGTGRITFLDRPVDFSR